MNQRRRRGSTGVLQHNRDRIGGNEQGARQALRIPESAQGFPCRKGRRESSVQAAEGLVAARVHAVVVRKVRRVLDSLNPILTRLVPCNGFRQTRTEFY